MNSSYKLKYDRILDKHADTIGKILNLNNSQIKKVREQLKYAGWDILDLTEQVYEGVTRKFERSMNE